MSRWFVGSSRISRSLSATSVRASATRLACPPESVAHVGLDQRAHAEAVEHRGGLPRPSPTAASITATRGAAPGSGRARRCARRGPSRTDARLGLTSPVRTCSRVDLPQPLRPDEAEPVTGRHGERQVGEERPARPAHRHPLDVDEDHAREARAARTGPIRGPGRSPVACPAVIDVDSRHHRCAPRSTSDPTSEPARRRPLDRRPLPRLHRRAVGGDLRGPRLGEAPRRPAHRRERRHVRGGRPGVARPLLRLHGVAGPPLGRARRPARPRGPGRVPRAPRAGAPRPRWFAAPRSSSSGSLPSWERSWAPSSASSRRDGSRPTWPRASPRAPRPHRSPVCRPSPSR